MTRLSDAQFVQENWHLDRNRQYRDGCIRCHKLIQFTSDRVYCDCVEVTLQIAESYAGSYPERGQHGRSID